MADSPPRKWFHHVGLRAYTKQPKEHRVPPSKCWVTNPAHHPQRIEYLRYDADSPISEAFMEAPHIAYAVDDLAPHLAGKEIYLHPFDVGDPPFATVAFTIEDGLFIEYMQFRPGRKWFDDFES